MQSLFILALGLGTITLWGLTVYAAYLLGVRKGSQDAVRGRKRRRRRKSIKRPRVDRS